MKRLLILLLAAVLLAGYAGWLIGYRAGWQAAQPVTLDSGRE